MTALSVLLLLAGLQDGGILDGTVSYQADKARPWRYARYYVKKGMLAEAVVALEAKDVKADPPESPSTAVIDQKNFQFTPELVAIRAGDRVKFTNSDNAVHNVRAVGWDHSFNESMPAGGEHVETFKAATGLKQPYRVGCVYHSAMRAWVFVFDHPRFSVTPETGRFRLEGVPPGTYTLRLAHPAGELEWSSTVTIKAGTTSTVEIRLTPDHKKKKD